MYSLSNLYAMELALHTLQSTAPEIAKLTRITRDEDELARLRVPGAVGAIITDIAARMWPYKFVAGILEDMLTATSLPGGTFNLQTLTPVTGLARISRGSVSGWLVQTNRGSIQANKVVLATNAYTSHLIPTLADLIVPVRGQMSALHPLPSLTEDKRLKTSFGFAGDGIDDYLIQRPNESGGHLMFGGGRQFLPCVGETDDSVLDAETAKYLRRRLVDALALPEGIKDTERRTRRSDTGLACDHCRTRNVCPRLSTPTPWWFYTSFPALLMHHSIQQIHCSGPSPVPTTSGDNRCRQCVRFGLPCGSFAERTSNPQPQARDLEFKASHEWTGIMGFSRDDLPWVGEVPACLLPHTTKQEQEDPLASSLSSAFLHPEDKPNTSQAMTTQASHVHDSDSTGLFLAAGYTGHGMPNTWLCGASVAHMLSSCAFCNHHDTSTSTAHTELTKENSHVLCLSSAELAVEATGLPKSYLISEERVRRARGMESVFAKDWAEMDRGRGRARGDRPHSGYA